MAVCEERGVRTWAMKAGSQAAALIWWIPRSSSPVRFTRRSLKVILVLVAASMRLASHLLMGTSSSTTARPPRNASRTWHAGKVQLIPQPE